MSLLALSLELHAVSFRNKLEIVAVTRHNLCFEKNIEKNRHPISEEEVSGNKEKI